MQSFLHYQFFSRLSDETIKAHVGNNDFWKSIVIYVNLLRCTDKINFLIGYCHDHHCEIDDDFQLVVTKRCITVIITAIVVFKSPIFFISLL